VYGTEGDSSAGKALQDRQAAGTAKQIEAIGRSSGAGSLPKGRNRIPVWKVFILSGW
jgi:hypothetical protein